MRTATDTPTASRTPGRHAFGPPGYPLLGHLPGFLRDKIGFLSRCADTYGDVVRLRLGEDTYLLTAPDDVRHVLVVNADNYVKTPRLTSERGRALSGSGLLTSVGPEHLRQRRLMQPSFNRRVVETFARCIVEGVVERMAGWTVGRELDIWHEATLMTQRNIVKMALGNDADAEMPQLVADIAVRRRYMMQRFFSAIPEWVPTPLGRAYRGAMARIDTLVAGAIEARRRRPGEPRDLLSMLLAARYDDGTEMSDQQLHDEIVTLLVTGSETNAEALTWTCYLLGRHPDVEAGVRDEVDRVLDGRAPTAADCLNLAYTNMVLAESMRLYPPTWIFVRLARKADRLPGGVDIPGGAKIYLSQYVSHRHPRFFPDPERFTPERFSDEARKKLPPCAYFPFGAGVRLCIGEHIARLESACALASIMQGVVLAPVTDEPIQPKPTMTLTPDRPVRMRVVARRDRIAQEPR
jgi:cytochrome P450